ncbi:MAG TPA: GntG family PLP-dependent aldolase [Hyphomicrobiaceae bacterium]|nr:GntG family PLP-dependent aldolase [Hyphomicrobiaceae bacterium]
MDVPITIDLISDTSTRPSAGMWEAMARAEVGDEQRGEDPSVNRLCEHVAEMLGTEAAVFLPSGIMSNLIAILVHCRPGDEVLSAANAHIISSEGAGAAAIAGVLNTTIDTPDGRFSIGDVEARIRPRGLRVPRTRLIAIEQTSNKGGGTIWPLSEIAGIARIAADADVAMHMDGARLLNAAVESGVEAGLFAQHFDSLWIDLSKGLGCPVGSVLAGSRAFIDEAWVWKHRLGGAMRQSGVLAAAGLYALEHHVKRLADDHANARRLAAGLGEIDGLRLVGERVETNIVFMDCMGTGLTVPQIVARLSQFGVRVGGVSDKVFRAVTHHDVSSRDIETTINAFGAVLTGSNHAKGAAP